MDIPLNGQKLRTAAIGSRELSLRTCMISLSILLTLLCTCAQTERHCAKGLRTMGYTEPAGDIYIKYGNPLDITCVIDAEYIQHENNSSSRLYFERAGVPLPSEMIEILNSSSIKLHVEKPPKSIFMYTCVLRDEGGVCLNYVVVGTEPLHVTDFECISYNYENLTCTWTLPKNYVKTTYNLTYFFPGRAARLLHVCPNLIKYSENKMSCLWTISSTPPYRQGQRIFNFELHMTNVFGSTILNTTFSHFQHVLSNPPENLTFVNVTSESIFLHWSVPSLMQNFAPGLQHRVVYKSQFGNKNWEFGGMMTTVGDEMKNVYFNLTNLKYAHAQYDIRVSMRTTAAAPDDELMWSKNTSLTVGTSRKIPGGPPLTNIGSFEIVFGGSSLNIIDMYVYWQQIPEQIENGEDFMYQIVIQGNTTRAIKPPKITSAYARFSNLNIDDDYTFRIWSQNRAGRSEKESLVYVPKESERIGEPVWFTKTAFGNGKYELSWEPPKKPSNASVKNYTIFWCTYERDQDQCSGYLKWVDIPHDKTIYNITVSEDKLNQFAISANSETSSSGMVWATCTIIHNKAIGKMEIVYIVHVDATFIQIGWKLDCSDGIGSVKGFIVYYCNIMSPSSTNCKEPEQNFTIYGGSSTSQANITNLKPYQTYMLAVAVLTKRNTQSQKSIYLNATTLQEAPNAPTNIQITNITNSSLTIRWRKPSVTNGQLKNYKIMCNMKTFDVGPNLEEYTVHNLLSYTDFNVSVEACTVKCSKSSPTKLVTTLGGYPSKISQPGVTFHNDSYIVIKWDPPKNPSGNNDIYEVNFKEKPQNRNETTALVNVTGTRYVIEDCGVDGKYNSFYISVRAVNIFHGVRYEGPWSDELESYCLITSSNWWLLTFIPLCLIIVLALFYIAKKIYRRYGEMRKVVINLPPGLASEVWSSSTEDFHKNALPLADFVAAPPTVATGYVTVPTDNVNMSPCNSKDDASGSYCVFGENPSPVTSINPNYVPVGQPESTKLPSSLPDASTESSAYVVTGDLDRPSNSGYVPLNSPEMIDNGPVYVMAENTGIAVPYFMRLDSVRSPDVEDKPVYMQVVDASSAVRETTPDACILHQPSLDSFPPRTGYVSVGDTPGSPEYADSTKGYIPHRHFDAKTLTED